MTYEQCQRKRRDWLGGNERFLENLKSAFSEGVFEVMRDGLERTLVVVPCDNRGNYTVAAVRENGDLVWQ